MVFPWKIMIFPWKIVIFPWKIVIFHSYVSHSQQVSPMELRMPIPHPNCPGFRLESSPLRVDQAAASFGNWAGPSPEFPPWKELSSCFLGVTGRTWCDWMKNLLLGNLQESLLFYTKHIYVLESHIEGQPLGLWPSKCSLFLIFLVNIMCGFDGIYVCSSCGFDQTKIGICMGISHVQLYVCICIYIYILNK